MQTKEMRHCDDRASKVGERPGGGAVQGVNSGPQLRPLRSCPPHPRAAKVPAAGKVGLCGGHSVRSRRWLRYDRRIGSWLALVALAIQLAVSFGHFHSDATQRTDAAGATQSPQAHAAKSLPARQPSDDGDDYCPICASIYLAANSFVPEAPHLPVPLVSQDVEPFDSIADILVLPRRAPFQSRAPPLV